MWKKNGEVVAIPKPASSVSPNPKASPAPIAWVEPAEPSSVRDLEKFVDGISYILNFGINIVYFLFKFFIRCCTIPDY